MMDKPTRVLQILHNLKRGGVQADTLYPERLLPKESLACDLLLLSDTQGELEKEFEKYGRIFRIPLRRSKSRISRAFHVWYDPLRVYRQTLILLRENGPYDAVHARHMMFIAPCLLAGKKAKVPVRIGHSHVNAPDIERLYIRLYLAICKKIIAKCATLRVGVTRGSCEYLFGNDKSIKVIKTPTVDLLKFVPRENITENHSGLFLIQIGSFGDRKNQLFTLDVLNALIKRGIDARLTLIGYANPGSCILDSINSKITALELTDRVMFLPSDTNVAEALASSEIMLLPSKQEGLPNTSLEAQAMGVPCFLSSAITTESDMGLCSFLPLEAGAEYWADQIAEYVSKNGTEKKLVDMSSYDSRRVCRQYLALWRGASWEEAEKCLFDIIE